MFDPSNLNRRSVLAGTAVAALLASAPSMVSAQAVAEGSVVLITGCSSGLGQLEALALARAGHTVVASMRGVGGRNAEEAAALQAIIDDEALPMSIVEIDVTDPESVASGVVAAQAVGPIEVLINNAGFGIPGPTEVHADEWVQRQIDTNLLGYYRMARAVLPDMRARGRGYIIQTSSGLGRLINAELGWYAATKHATEMISQLMAYELVPFGVDVTVLQPGRFDTDFTDNAGIYLQELLDSGSIDPERREAYASHIAISQEWTQSEPPVTGDMVAAEVVRLIEAGPGNRPLRAIASGRPDLVARINAELAETQGAFMANGPYGEWVATVNSRG
ncbi:SDR family NAD(P)-dependent oxidoreductase [Pontivivens ytuae]|uniref:SDR family NAD(P)-dependent oxidoreductase n=1 Tax=Pontivivens ytuae TaxID=2789856 RepID=A0A7S9LT43_9RHOB|nr:SDR family NAD(P)-dependent oxidoreductase [Pontivivens ytuae]QPH54796.1 SDR family NAD(P)-dependent oxidoreductase [Pontivivens ytuae]